MLSVASKFVEFFTPVVYLNLLVEIMIGAAPELSGIYEQMFGVLLDLGVPYVWPDVVIFQSDSDRTEITWLQFQGKMVSLWGWVGR